VRIVILASWYPAAANPAEAVFIQEQARALAGRHDIAVLVPQAGGGGALSVEPDSELGFPVYGQGGGQARAARGRFSQLRPILARLGLADVFNVPAYTAYTAAAVAGLNHIAREWGKPELVHAHVTLPGGLGAGRWAQAHGVPVVLTEHASNLQLHTSTPFKRKLAREVLLGAGQVIAVSPEQGAAIAEFCPGVKLNVVGNLVRTEFFGLADAPREPGPLRVLAVAMLHEKKGLRYLFDAAAQLIKTGADGFSITIGGDGPARPALEEQARQLGLGSRVRFLGRLSREQVRAQLQACDVFGLPSLHESFGIVFAEALACGKPVLSTTNGGARFVVEPGQGLLVEPADASALADGLRRFLRGDVQLDPPQRLRERVVERFSPAAICDQIDAVYAKALAALPAPVLPTS
jgi:L-malate glycosyltransferase